MKPRHQQLVDVAAEIMGEPTSDIDFLHVALAQVAMPYRDLGDQRDYVRDNGRVSLIITAGIQRNIRGDLEIAGLPYGPKPRLILTHLCSEAVRHQSATIPIADTLSGFLRDLGLPVAGRTITMFKQQVSRLSVARLQIRMVRDGRESVVNTQPIGAFDIWLEGDGRQRSLWPSEITLSAEFYESLRRHALPIDSRAIRALQHSARALDAYVWLAARLPRVKGDHAFVSWAALHHQFGGDQRDRKTFKRKMTEALRQALAVYPKARVSEADGGLLLYQSAPPISRRGD